MLKRIFLILFWTVSFCASIDEHQAAFIQTGEELRYFVSTQQFEETGHAFAGHSHGFMKSANAVDATTGDTQALNQLKFEPIRLQFGEHAVGIPHLQKVTVQNPTASRVRFDAITGSTVHFHCSFLDHKTVEPGGTTTFDVVFLARQEGVIENTIFIHSSLGTFAYTVTGLGIANPYRLRPYVGARIPLNGTFVSAVELHNPHPTTLRVTEMYSSGGDLHLELPNLPGRKEGVQYTWEIPPFQTKTVMEAKFLGAKVKNTTAYVRIKTNLSSGHDGSGGTLTISSHDATVDSPRKLMLDFPSPPPPIILPFEIEVVEKQGLFSTVDMIDFGIIRNEESSPILDIEVLSTVNRSVDINSVSSDPANGAVEITFEPLTLKGPGNPRKSTVVAKVRFHGAKLLQIPESRRKTRGHFVVKSKGGAYKLSVPYAANVLHGKLLHDTQETSFYAGHTPPLQQNVTVRNTFAFPVVVYNVSIPRAIRHVLKVRTVSGTVVIPSGGKEVAFALHYVGGLMAPLTSFCRLYTNLSKFDLPVHIFNGKLRITLYSIDQSQFDFGMLNAGDKRSVLFSVTNENPVPIPLNEFKGVMDSFTSLKLLGVEEGNETVLAKPHNSTSEFKWNPGQDFNIPANSFAVFEYTVTAPLDRAVYHSSMTFQTPYELLYYPVTFYIEEGAIVSIPEKIVFADAFPGKISSQPLQVYSTFPKDMPLLRLSTLSHDPRIFFESFDKNQPTPVIKHGEMSYLGRVFFFPIAGCMDDCYVGMPLNNNDGAWWVYGMRLPPNLPDIDAYLYSKLRRKWNAIEKAGEHIVNSTIIVDSTEVKQFQIPAKGQLVWPRLMKQSAVHFPLTAVGNFTIVNLTLHNPSSLPVVVQLLPLTIYPDPETLVELFKDEFPSPMTSHIEMNETLMFTLRDTELFNLRPDSPVPKFRQQLEESLGGILIPRFTLSLMLQPGMKVRVRVGFLPKDYELRSSLLLIRNNLTVLEPVCLYGRGARVELKVGNRLPRTVHSLLFDIQDHHLTDCQNPKRLTHKLMTTLTVRRSFMARNTGEVPVTVTNMTISGFSCQNRGFRVLNCEPFRLKPNETHLLEVAFTPDFTLSWYDASLQLYVQGNGTPFSYPLAASVPREWLEKCQSALPRPQWEPLMYYSCVTALLFLLICMVASAYLEGDRIITCALRQQLRLKQVFDLNSPSTISGTERADGIIRRSDIQEKNFLDQDNSLWGRVCAWVFALVAGTSGSSGKSKGDPHHKITNGVKAMADNSSATLRQRKQQSNKTIVSHQNLTRKNSTDETRKQKFGARQQQPQLQQQQMQQHQKIRQVPSPGEEVVSPQDVQYDEDWELVERVPKRLGTLNSQQQNSSGSDKTNDTTSAEHTKNSGEKVGKDKKLLYDSDKENARRMKRRFIAGSISDAEVQDHQNRGEDQNFATKEVQKVANNLQAELKVRFEDSDRTDEYERDSKLKDSLEEKTSQQSGSDLGCRKRYPTTQARKMQYSTATPYTYVAKLTTDVMNKSKLSSCGSASESEELDVPEWDTPSESVNYEEAFGELAARAEGFASTVAREEEGFHGGIPMDPSDKNSLTSSWIQRPASTDSASHRLEPLELVTSSSRSTSSSSLGRSGQETSDSSSPSPKEKTIPVPRKRQFTPSSSSISSRPMLYDDPPRTSGRDRKQPSKSQSKTRRQQQNQGLNLTLSPPPGLATPAGAMLRSPPKGTPVTPDEPKYPWPTTQGGDSLFGTGQKATSQFHEGRDNSKLTIMQQLQIERKKRLQEYRLQQQKTKGEEWPGMNLLSPVTESLWDDDCEPWNMTADQDAWGTFPTASFGVCSVPPGPVGEPLRTSPLPIGANSTSGGISKSGEEWSTHTGNSPDFTSPLFQLDPTVPPFVSSWDKGGLQVGEGSGRKKVTPPPDPGILAWAPSATSRKEEESVETLSSTPPCQSAALGLAGSLFSTGAGGIWDPNHPVNPDLSWTEALLSGTSEVKSAAGTDARSAAKKEEEKPSQFSRSKPGMHKRGNGRRQRGAVEKKREVFVDLSSGVKLLLLFCFLRVKVYYARLLVWKAFLSFSFNFIFLTVLQWLLFNFQFVHYEIVES